MPMITEEEFNKKSDEEKQALIDASHQERQSKEDEIRSGQLKQTAILAGIPLAMGALFGGGDAGTTVAANNLAQQDKRDYDAMLLRLKQKREPAATNKSKIFANKYGTYSTINPETGESIETSVGVPQRVGMSQVEVMEGGKKVLKMIPHDVFKFEKRLEETPIPSRQSGIGPAATVGEIAEKQSASGSGVRGAGQWIDPETGMKYSLGRDARGNVIKTKIGKSQEWDVQKQVEAGKLSEEMKGVEANELNLKVIEDALSKYEKGKVPGIGIMSTLAGYRLEFSYSSDAKAIRAAVSSLLRTEALATGGKNLTPNEKEMVQDAIGLTNSGDEDNVRKGMALYRQAHDINKARTVSKYSSEAQRRASAGMEKAKQATSGLSPEKKARLEELRAKKAARESQK